MTLRIFNSPGNWHDIRMALDLSNPPFFLLKGAMGFPVFAGTSEKGIGLFYMLDVVAGSLIVDGAAAL